MINLYFLDQNYYNDDDPEWDEDEPYMGDTDTDEEMNIDDGLVQSMVTDSLPGSAVVTAKPLLYSEPYYLPTLNLNDISTVQLESFYEALLDDITIPLPIEPGSEVKLRVLKRAEGSVRIQEFLLFLPVSHVEHTLNLIFRAHDMYSVADQDQNGNVRIYNIDNSLHIEEIEAALNSVGIPKDQYRVENNLLYDYPNLESKAKMERKEFKLGKSSLIQHFNLLSDPGISVLNLARCVIFFAQFISESMRITKLKTHIVRNFLDEKGITTPEDLILYQHSWAPTSRCLQRHSYKGMLTFEMFYSESEAACLPSDLREIYGALKNCSREYLQRYSINKEKKKNVMKDNYARRRSYFDEI